MVLSAERLVLRPWRLSDAVNLYQYAADERIGKAAGWPPHKSVDESREIIRSFFSIEGVFAVTLKGDDTPIGCIGVVRGAASNFSIPDNEGEISYWLGVPFWGKGLIPEATKEIIRYAFRELGLTTLWCGYYDGNEKSRKVQEKCGFSYHHTNPPAYMPLAGETLVEHISILQRDVWLSSQREE